MSYKVERVTTPKKTSQTIHVTKDQFDRISEGECNHLIEIDALNFSVKKKGTVKYKSKSKRINIRWIKWVNIDQIDVYSMRDAGFKTRKELETYITEKKPNWRSNSWFTIVCFN